MRNKITLFVLAFTAIVLQSCSPSDLANGYYKGTLKHGTNPDHEALMTVVEVNETTVDIVFSNNGLFNSEAHGCNVEDLGNRVEFIFLDDSAPIGRFKMIIGNYYKEQDNLQLQYDLNTDTGIVSGTFEGDRHKFE